MCHHFSDIEQILSYLLLSEIVFTVDRVHRHLSGLVFIQFSTTHSKEENETTTTTTTIRIQINRRTVLCMCGFWIYVEKLCFINLFIANLCVYITSFVSIVSCSLQISEGAKQLNAYNTVQCAFFNVNRRRNETHSKRYTNRITTKCIFWYFQYNSTVLLFHMTILLFNLPYFRSISYFFIRKTIEKPFAVYLNDHIGDYHYQINFADKWFIFYFPKCLEENNLIGKNWNKMGLAAAPSSPDNLFYLGYKFYFFSSRILRKFWDNFLFLIFWLRKRVPWFNGLFNGTSSS